MKWDIYVTYFKYSFIVQAFTHLIPDKQAVKNV
jgi:hypothetical protein